MATATQEVQITEIGDHTFRFNCPFPENVDDLTAFPYFDVNDQWDQYIDLGEDGFEVRINPQYWDGRDRGIPGVLDVLQSVWAKLYELGTVQSSALPEITFGVNGQLSNLNRG